MKKNQKKKKEFSKILVAQESCLIWIITIFAFILAYICIKQQYFGELPWITALVGFPWTAYGVSQGFYYNKAKMENQIKLKKKYPKETENIEDTFFEDYSMNPESGQDGPEEGI